jgi:hypothetical protein
VFSQILNYYRSGKLHYPTNVCGPLFEEELDFWGLDSNQVEPCCWKTYTKHRTTAENLLTLDNLNIDVDKTPKEDLIILFGIDRLPQYRRGGRLPFFKRIQPIIWQMFEEPRSSNLASMIAIIQITMIISSVVIFWNLTMPYSKYNTIHVKSSFLANNNSLIDVIDDESFIYLRLEQLGNLKYLILLDYLTIAWFIIDISTRLAVAPNKHVFFHNFNNVVDIIATLTLLIDIFHDPYMNNLITQSIQVIRVFRLFRLLTYHSGLQVIITSLKKSVQILQLLVFWTILAILYGSLIYYVERLTTNDPDEKYFYFCFWFLFFFSNFEFIFF